MGRPIIQFPQDMMALQELVWRVQPDAVVETGVAHGGSILYSASLLELLGGDRIAVGIDIDIRAHNRAEIEAHPMFPRVRLVEGSSIAPETIERVFDLVRDRKRLLVILDSNHTHDHVLQELRAYSTLVGEGSYLIVYDTLIEDMPEELGPERPWGKGNNPKTALFAFMKESGRFEIDKELEAKLLSTVAPDGYLRCTKDPK